MMKTGSGLIILWAIYFIHQLYRRAAIRAVPPGAEQIVDFHRRELARRRDMMKSMWQWQLLPMLPGMALIFLSRIYQVHVPGRPPRFDHLVIALSGIIVVLIYGVVVLIQRLRVHALQRRIDELDAQMGQ